MRHTHFCCETKKLLFILALLLACSPAWGTIAFVNAQIKQGGTTGSNTSPSFAATAGNTQLVFAAFYNGQSNTPNVTSITNCNSDVYTNLGVVQPANNVFIEAWFATFSASNAACTTTVTSTPTGTGTSIALEFDQYSGVGAVNTSNVSSANGTSNTSGSITLTTSQANDWVAGAFADHPANAITTNGFSTPRGNAVNNGGATTQEYEGDDTGATASPVTVDWTTTGAVAWTGIAVELCVTSPCVASSGSHVRHQVITN